MTYTTILPEEDEFKDIVTRNSIDSGWRLDEGLKYYIQPTIDANEGEFVMKVEVQVTEPIEAAKGEFIISFEINPCITTDIIHGNQGFNNYYVIEEEELTF